MEQRPKSFLGTGWSFPVSFDPAARTVRMVSQEEDIEESIRIILGTTPGERIMHPTFGCNLNSLVFEEMDAKLLSGLNHLIYYALLDFEPRINFLGLEVAGSNQREGRLDILISYAIIITNTRHNMVYPFYLREGTNISNVYKEPLTIHGKQITPPLEQ